MNIGDKVRFLNDVGGGTITAFRPGGIVLVEDEEGFDIPVREDEVVAIETNHLNFAKKPAPKVTYGQAPAQDEERLAGKEYLKSKSASALADEEMDENLEARVVRLEMTIRRLEMRLARLEDAKAAKEKEKIKAKEERRKDKNEPIEMDLHAAEVLETTAGISPGDIKDYQLKIFRETMDAHLHEKGRRIIFIHGKGVVPRTINNRICIAL